MTTRLYCRECGWHPVYRRKRTALRAAGRHRCTTTPLATTTPRRRSWSRLFGTSPTTTTDDNNTDQPTNNATEFADIHGNRIQWAVLAAHHAETTRRARQAMVDLVRAGYQIGPPPYGYRALRIRVTDPTGHSKLRAVLVPDWQTAAVVKQIFTWRAAHRLGFTAIASRLNSDPRHYPPPTHAGQWTAQAARRIVTNPKYTGRQVWARTIAGRPVPAEQWVTSAPRVHEPLIDERTFHRAQPDAHNVPVASPEPGEAPPRAA
jgi:hypothetical protein